MDDAISSAEKYLPHVTSLIAPMPLAALPLHQKLRSAGFSILHKRTKALRKQSKSITGVSTDDVGKKAAEYGADDFLVNQLKLKRS
jgi:hypothetical protein